ncbi:MAG: hypothetical protein H7832_05445 [Magnetococcus sp. DMHC-6]
MIKNGIFQTPAEPISTRFDGQEKRINNRFAVNGSFRMPVIHNAHPVMGQIVDVTQTATPHMAIQGSFPDNITDKVLDLIELNIGDKSYHCYFQVIRSSSTHMVIALQDWRSRMAEDMNKIIGNLNNFRIKEMFPPQELTP